MFDPENPFVCLYEGFVIDNKDPSRMGRVKLCVPGLIEPASDWTLPLGMPGAGSDARGFWIVPAVGSNVAVMFREGCLEEMRYLTGPWARPAGSDAESPTFVRDLSPAEATEVVGVQTAQWNIVMDDRAGANRLVIESRTAPGNGITLDANSQAVEVRGGVAVQIKSNGVVNIEALQVVINGRVVLPTGKPI